MASNTNVVTCVGVRSTARAVDKAKTAPTGTRPGGKIASAPVDWRLPTDQSLPRQGGGKSDGLKAEVNVGSTLPVACRWFDRCYNAQALAEAAASEAAVLGSCVDHFHNIQVNVPASFPVRPMVAARATVAAPRQ